ncbi:ABC transporter permease [Aurantimonas sp. C2-6-R+9]|uniref:ABC transporter permease n=1 Tax=unclassified Aurantimonas TaxID=2638230 RepID=UPI002E17ED3E|nr:MULTISPECIES: ABC transporter permease [unclassified Aurantimonas]MEC5292576.1 ABC transporter permease [Aurantimonas sp. C2-3-R2]MEC5382042.1 ABC transporter permease [Aurantimonas sp. C2-6-R+9]MEC5413632.1 ABC transporter permease [Aurantimonas sp. C2-4-R8]
MGARLAGLLVKELLQFLRDPLMLILILWLYTAEVVICAYALSFEVENMPMAVVDLDRSPQSRTLVRRFLATDVFADAGRPASATEAGAWLQAGRARVALIVPPGFQRDLLGERRPNLQLLLDGSNSNMAAQARGYALEIVGRFAAIGDGGTAAGPMPMVRVWYNRDQTFTAFVVLSMVALAALMVGVIHPAASIVREKEAGTIEQLRVTPIRTPELFVAKTLPTLVMGLLSVFPSLLIVWWFDIPLRGSLLLFLGLTAIFLLSAIGIGVLIASVSRTLQQALLLAFFGLFPLMFLSGTLAPIESMPEVLLIASLASPLRHYMDVTLGIFLKGVGIRELWPSALALLAIGIPLFAMAIRIFKQKDA